jgi:hypothetical protein
MLLRFQTLDMKDPHFRHNFQSNFFFMKNHFPLGFFFPISSIHISKKCLFTLCDQKTARTMSMISSPVGPAPSIAPEQQPANQSTAPTGKE